MPNWKAGKSLDGENVDQILSLPIWFECFLNHSPCCGT